MAEMKNTEGKIDSPDKLEAYLHVTKPVMWVVFGGVLTFVAALIVWASLSSLDIKVKCQGFVENGIVSFYVSGIKSERVKTGQPIRIGNEHSTIDKVIDINDELDAASGEDSDEKSENNDSDKMIVATAHVNQDNGVYEVEVDTGSVSPIYFLFN